MAHFYICCVDGSAVIKNNSRINLRARSYDGTYIAIEGNINYSVRTGGLVITDQTVITRAVVVSCEITQDCGDIANLELNLSSDRAVIINKTEITELDDDARKIFKKLFVQLPDDVKLWIRAGEILRKHRAKL